MRLVHQVSMLLHIGFFKQRLDDASVMAFKLGDALTEAMLGWYRCGVVSRNLPLVPCICNAMSCIVHD